LKIKTNNNFFFGLVYQNFPKLGEPRLILNDLTTVTKQECMGYSFFDLFEKNFKNHRLSKQNTPFMIAHLDGNIPQFESTYFDIDTVNYLNHEGLDIYIYEVTIFYQGPKRKYFYIDTNIEEFKNKESNDIIFDSQNIDNVFCFEFDSIADMVTRNGLTNVTVHVLDYQNEKYLQQKYPMFKIVSEEFYIKTLIDDTGTSYGFDANFKKKFRANLIEHKFISLNWRYTTYRHLIVTHLVSKDSLCTWGFNTDIKDAQFYFDITQWDRFTELETNSHLLLEKVPLMLDVDMEKTSAERERHSIPVTPFKDTMFCPMEERIPIDSYAKCFCAVVTESEFYRPSAVIGEKIANAMKCGRPFIMVGAPYCLEYLKTLGFKTFDAYWDESYDTIENHEQRLQVILDLINTVDNMPINKLKEMYEDMLPIIEHNYGILQGYTR